MKQGERGEERKKREQYKKKDCPLSSSIKKKVIKAR